MLLIQTGTMLLFGVILYFILFCFICKYYAMVVICGNLKEVYMTLFSPVVQIAVSRLQAKLTKTEDRSFVQRKYKRIFDDDILYIEICRCRDYTIIEFFQLFL